MRAQRVLAGLLVADIDRAAEYYARFFGRAADAVPMASCHEWYFPSGGIQVVQDEKRAGASSICLEVPELDVETKELATRGIEAPAAHTVPGFVRYVTLTDPDGNEVTVVEPITEGV